MPAVNRFLRILLVLYLIGVIFGFGIHYDTTFDEQWPYPGSEELNHNYEEYIGETVLLWATVQEIDGEAHAATIVIAGMFSMTAEQFDATVAPGGTVQIYGTLGPDRTIVAHRIVVVNPTARSDAYKYVVSLIGVALVVVSFFRYWRVDIETLCFETR